MLSNSSKILIIFLFFIIIIVILSRFYQSKKENFENSEESYQSRLAVIDVFDSHLKRNPTPKEINKYSTFKNEQDILSAVLKDFPDKKKEDFTDTEENKCIYINNNIKVNSNNDDDEDYDDDEEDDDEDDENEKKNEKIDEKVYDEIKEEEVEKVKNNKDTLPIPVDDLENLTKNLQKTLVTVQKTLGIIASFVDRFN